MVPLEQTSREIRARIKATKERDAQMKKQLKERLLGGLGLASAAYNQSANEAAAQRHAEQEGQCT